MRRVRIGVCIFALYTLVISCSSGFGKNYNSIFDAAKAGDVEAVAKFLSQGASPTDVDEKGMSVLHHAVQSGNVDLVSRLISSGAKVNAKDNEGRTPMQIAIQKKDRPMMRVLEEYGAQEQ